EKTPWRRPAIVGDKTRAIHHQHPSEVLSVVLAEKKVRPKFEPLLSFAGLHVHTGRRRSEERHRRSFRRTGGLPDDLRKRLERYDRECVKAAAAVVIRTLAWLRKCRAPGRRRGVTGCHCS